MMNAETIPGLPKQDELELELADRWIYSRLNQVIIQTREYYENLRLNDAAQCLFQFIWDEFCSWYIELAKDRLYRDVAEGQQDPRLTAKYILLDVMQASMRLLHPIMPYITEEIWQSIREIFPMQDTALITAEYPVADPARSDDAIADEMSFIQESISAIRNLRKQINLPPSTGIKVVIRIAEEKQKALFVNYESYLSKLARVEDATIGLGIDKPAPAIAAVVRNIEIFLPLSGLVDLDAEKARLSKALDKLQQELAIIAKKLDNQNFVANAKPEVVEKEREKFREVETKMSLTKELLLDLGV
jgi:valyl-tRNA synthetase